jgi:phage-related protein
MDEEPKLSVKFFKTPSGKEPVREWLSDPKQVKPEDKKTIGVDIKTVQFGWPLGMPLVEKLETDLWEIRSHVSVGIARVLFTIKQNTIVLLIGFIKKSAKIPTEELELGRNRKNLTQRGE